MNNVCKPGNLTSSLLAPSNMLKLTDTQAHTDTQTHMHTQSHIREQQLMFQTLPLKAVR